MARPQKFRHQREELADAKVAEKLGRFVIEIEDLRAQRSKIDEMLAAAYDAVDEGGFEKKFVRKVVSLRAKEEGIRQDEEDGLESYEFAIEKGVSLARTRRKPANDQFDPITGEFVEDIRTAPVSANETPKQVYGDSVEAATAPPSQSVDIPAGGDTHQEADGSNGQCPAEIHSPETAEESPRKAAEAVSERTAIQVDASASAEAGVSGQPEMIPATSAESAGEAVSADLPTNSQSDDGAISEVNGKAGLENAAGVEPSSSVQAKRPQSPLRPHCLHPGETCGGSGRDHCHPCLKARQEEAA
jgi:uncharacterized protein (UPF0335 family)